jgi:hypothetical protein
MLHTLSRIWHRLVSAHFGARMENIKVPRNGSIKKYLFIELLKINENI